MAAVLVLGVLVACHATPPQAPGHPVLRLAFLRDFNPQRTPAANALAPSWGAAALGGLSGLSYAESSRTLYGVSDNCSRGPARIYSFEVELSATRFRVEPRSVLPLRDTRGTGALDLCDGESLAADPAGGFFIGTENHDNEPGMRFPSILRVTQEGLITGSLPLPEALLPEADGPHTRGTRDNGAFEGLSVSPSGRWLSAITETALQQDGPDASFEQGTIVRLLRWDLAQPGPPEQFRYAAEPVPRPAGGVADLEGGNGVSELLSLDDQRLLVLERAYVAPPHVHGVNTIRIFEVTLPSARPAAVTDAIPLLPKRLVLDLDEILPQLQPGQQTLDNLEGMAFGPRLPSGERTLLLVSDDNFNPAQRTTFLAFRLLE
ncbi:MAG TPA: esterase-like activity of phytase family protein [Polyangiaceae bacterium]|jgi:hypothetical protein|nr:esterase-like activity of phytase family protein [Polyangiaceae bacterium]